MFNVNSIYMFIPFSLQHHIAPFREIYSRIFNVNLYPSLFQFREWNGNTSLLVTNIFLNGNSHASILKHSNVLSKVYSQWHALIKNVLI